MGFWAKPVGTQYEHTTQTQPAWHWNMSQGYPEHVFVCVHNECRQTFSLFTKNADCRLTYTHIYTHTRTHPHTHTYIYICTYGNSYGHTHTQTSLSLSLFTYTSCHSGKVVGNIYISPSPHSTSEFSTASLWSCSCIASRVSRTAAETPPKKNALIDLLGVPVISDRIMLYI